MKTITKKMANGVCVFLVLTLLVIQSSVAYSQFVINDNYSPQYLVENILLGSGVSVSNVSYTGSFVSLGSFTQGNSSILGLSNGIVLSTGKVADLVGANTVPNKQYNTLGGSDPQLQSLTPLNSIYDAAVLEFDFVPTSDSIQFRFVFGSEEYSEWIGSNFNDVFGFFVSGVNPLGGTYSNFNIATLPGSGSPISTNTINNGINNLGPCTNCGYYINNTAGITTQLDGITTVIIAKLKVVPCQTYHIKIAIGDGADHSYDSGVFLEANSFTSLGMHVNTTVFNQNGSGNTLNESCDSAALDFILSSPLSFNYWIPIQATGLAQNGIDYVNIPDSILIPAGVDSVRLYVRPILDALAETNENLVLLIPISSCAYDTITFNIIDYLPLTANIIGNTSNCKNDQITLFGNISGGIAPYNYSWGNNLSTDSVSFIGNLDTLITLNIGDVCGSSYQVQKSILVHNLPNITISTSKDSICYGEEVVLLAQGVNSFNWYNNNTLIAGNISDSLIINPTSTLNIKVVGVDSNNCSNSSVQHIYVQAQTNLSATPMLNSICLGDTASFSISGASQYMWNTNLLSNSLNYDSVTILPLNTDSFWVKTTISGCVDSINVKVIVHDLPTLDLQSSFDTLCNNMATTIFASGGSNYQWWPTQTISQNNGSNIIVSPNVSTTYYVQANNLQGCVNTDSISFHVYNKPNIVLKQFTGNSLCKGDSIKLGAKGAQYYYWKSENQTIALNQSTIFFKPNKTTTISLIGFDVFGCSDTVTETIHVLPEFEIKVNDSIVCDGNMVMASVISDNLGLNYLWSNGETTSSAQYNITAPTQISVSVTNPIGCTESKSKNIYIHPQINFSLSQNLYQICPGDYSLITASNTSSFDSLIWNTQTVWSSINNDSIIVSPTQTTTYELMGFDNNGCQHYSNNTATLTVNPLPNVVASPQYINVQPNANTSLSVSGAQTYQWHSQYNSSPINGGSTIIVNTDKLTKYYVKGTHSNGCVNYDTVTVFPRPLLHISATLPQICIGDSTLLTAVTNVNCHYLWSNGAITQSIWVKPMQSSSYSVSVIDILGFTNSESINIVVYTKPTIFSTQTPIQVCAGQSSRIDVRGAKYYQWHPSSNLNKDWGNSVITNTTSNTVYQVIGSDNFGCRDTITIPVFVVPSASVSVQTANYTICEGESVSMSASGTQSYRWVPGFYLNDSLISSVTSSPEDTINYMVIGTNSNGCSDTEFVSIDLKPKPKLKINTDSIELCVGDSVKLISFGANSYQWFPSNGLSSNNSPIVIANPNISTNYLLVGTNTHSCNDSINIQIGVHAYPNININPTSTQICPNDSAILTAVGANFYTWSPSINLDTNKGPIVVSTPDTAISYQVIGSTIYGCTDTAVIDVDVFPISRIIANTTHICAGDSVLLTAVTNISNATYLWSNGHTTQSTWAKPSTSQNISLYTSLNNSCTHIESVYIKVESIPSVSVTSNVSIVCPDSPVILTAQGAIIYNWSTNTSIISMYGQSIIPKPQHLTTYTVVGSSLIGCSDSASITINTYPQPQLVLSPSFTTLCSGNSQLLTVNGALNYQWFPNIGLSNQTGDSVTVIPNTNMNYMVIGTDSIGCTDTAFANFITCTNANITSPDSYICYGDSIVLTANSLNIPNSYLWSTGDTTKMISISPQLSTSYSVTLTYFSGCSKVSYATMQVFNDSSVSAYTTTPTICYGDSVQITATNGQSFSWQGNGIINSPTTAVITVMPNIDSWFHISAISTHGCLSEDSVFISHYYSPPIQLSSNNSTICLGDTIQFSASGGLSYQWLNSDIISNGNSAIVQPIQSAIYSVVGYDMNQCSDTASVSVTTITPPSFLTVPERPSVCLGDSILVSINGNGNYSWSNSPYLTIVNSNQALLHPPTNTFFSISATNNFGCISDTLIKCDIKRKPIIYLNQDSSQICEGDSIMLTALGADNYYWLPQPLISNVNNDTVYYKPLISGSVSLRGMSTDGCIDSVHPYISVSTKPNIVITSNSTQICQGDSLIINAISNNISCSYQWNNGDTIPNINTIAQTSQNLTLVGTTNDGCIDSSDINIQVFNRPDIGINHQDTTICNGDSLNLQITNNQSYSLSWSTGSSTSSTIIYPNGYQVVSLIATDTNNCIDTATININTHQLPNISINTNSTLICELDTVHLQCNYTDSTLSFLWNTGNSTTQITTVPNNTITYSITAIDSIGCSFIDSISIAVVPPPQFSFQPTYPVICYGDSIILSIVSINSSLNYAWGGGPTVPQIITSPTANTIYSVTATDTIGCISEDSILVTVNPLPQIILNAIPNRICRGDSALIEVQTNQMLSSYIWSNGSISNSISISPIITSIYGITVTDTNNCSNSTQVTIPVDSLPIVNAQISDSAICSMDTIVLSVSSNNPITSILWNNGQTTSSIFQVPLINTSYYVSVIDTNGCIGSDSTFVMVSQRPSCTILANTPICLDDSSMVSYQGNATSNAIFYWQFQGAPIVNGSGMGPISLNWLSDGQYYVKLEVEENSCISFPDSIEITVNALPNVDFSTLNNHHCDSSAVHFVNSCPGLSEYHWKFGNPLSSDTSSLPNPSYVYSVPGNYSVSLSVVDVNGCKNSITKSSIITIFPKPHAAFTLSTRTPDINKPTVNFFNNSSSYKSLEWNFGEPQSGIYNTSTQEDPYHVYFGEGEFPVRLMVQNSHNCFDTAIAIISIKKGPSMYIPDAFTPNGDGLNEFFTPVGVDFIMSSFQIYIYDRWGRIVYESHNYDNHWNGKHYKSGEKLPDGVFNYVIYATDIENVNRKFTGSVTMFR